MLQSWGGTAQPGTHTVSIRLAPLRRAGVGTPAHWVQAAQGIWLTVQGHADRKETYTQINLNTSTQRHLWASTHTLSHTNLQNQFPSFKKQTGSIKMDNPTNSKTQGYGILKSHTCKVCPESFNQSRAKVGIFLLGLRKVFLLSVSVTSHP